jgi:hypothetical protein
MKRLPLLVLSMFALAVVAVPTLAASKPKPLAFGYGQCSSKTTCSFSAITNPAESTIRISTAKPCPSGGGALGQLPPLRVKNGKFSKTATEMVNDPDLQTVDKVKVVVKGRLKAHKSAKGTLTVTTTASDCTKVSGKTVHFNMKYTGPIYGG